MVARTRQTRVVRTATTRSRIANGVVRAYRAAQPIIRPLAKAAARYVTKKVTSKSKGKKSMNSIMHHDKGTYQGKFKKPLKRNVDTLAKYLKCGVVHNDEIIGTVSDIDCVYLMHQAADPGRMITYGVYSLVRHLLEKVGHYKIESLDSIVSNWGNTDGDGLQFAILGYNVQDVTASVSQLYQYNSVSASSVRTIGNQMASDFLLYSQNYNTYSVYKGDIWTKFRLLQRNAGTTVFVVVGEIDLRNTTIHYNCKSQLKLQNNSLGSSTADEADVGSITANPLQGYLYHFNSMPKSSNVHVKYLEAFHRGDNVGVMAVGANTVLTSAPTAQNGLRNPPLPKQWKNVKSSSRIRLEPGAIKSSYVVYKKSMNFMKMLTYIHWNPSAPSTIEYYPVSISPVDMIALEEVINFGVNSSTVLTRFECEKTMACYCSSYDSKTPIMASYQSTTFSLT